jgi:hypothetical protein
MLTSCMLFIYLQTVVKAEIDNSRPASVASVPIMPTSIQPKDILRQHVMSQAKRRDMNIIRETNNNNNNNNNNNLASCSSKACSEAKPCPPAGKFQLNKVHLRSKKIHYK